VHRIDTGLIEASGQQLRLGANVAVDARESVLLACKVLAGATDDDGIDFGPLYVPGDLLPDCYDDWVMAQRERVRQLRLHALETLCIVLTGQGRYGQAIQAGLAAVCGEPLRESADRALIAAHLAEGNHSEALRRYRTFKVLLHDELEIGPTAQMEDLVRPLTE
jgi:DNA-binding SARP family transcriptional activator